MISRQLLRALRDRSICTPHAPVALRRIECEEAENILVYWMGTQNGVVAEIDDGAPSSLGVSKREVSHRHRWRQGRIILDDIDMLIRHVRARGWHLDGIDQNKATRPELQGHPVRRG